MNESVPNKPEHGFLFICSYFAYFVLVLMSVTSRSNSLIVLITLYDRPWLCSLVVCLLDDRKNMELPASVKEKKKKVTNIILN